VGVGLLWQAILPIDFAVPKSISSGAQYVTLPKYYFSHPSLVMDG
jgi:hypothetical protein